MADFGRADYLVTLKVRVNTHALQGPTQVKIAIENALSRIHPMTVISSEIQEVKNAEIEVPKTSSL